MIVLVSLIILLRRLLVPTVFRMVYTSLHQHSFSRMIFILVILLWCIRGVVRGPVLRF